MIKLTTLPQGEVHMQLMPKNCNDIKLQGRILEWKSYEDTSLGWVRLPENCELLGVIGEEISEELAKSIVEEAIFEYIIPGRLSPWRKYGFKNYINPSWEKGGCSLASESLQTLIESKGIDLNKNNVVIILKRK